MGKFIDGYYESKVVKKSKRWKICGYCERGIDVGSTHDVHTLNHMGFYNVDTHTECTEDYLLGKEYPYEEES